MGNMAAHATSFVRPACQCYPRFHHAVHCTRSDLYHEGPHCGRAVASINFCSSSCLVKNGVAQTAPALIIFLRR